MVPSILRSRLLASPSSKSKSVTQSQAPKTTQRKVRVAFVVIIALLLLSVFLWQWEAALWKQLFDRSHLQKIANRVIITPPDLWEDPPNEDGWAPCLERDPGHQKPVHTGRYAAFYLDGGLGQQAWELCYGVILSRLLNVTMILPSLTVDPYWKDPTPFEAIFNVSHFVDTLKDDILTVHSTDMPIELQDAEAAWYRDFWGVWKGPPDLYLREALPLFQNNSVVQFVSMWQSLDDFALSPELLKLACRAKFEALRFSDPILDLGNNLLARMRHHAGGPFVALHLRFEEDMLAHSGCVYWGGVQEQERWAEMRRKREWPIPTKSDFQLRDHGKCPPSPEEIGTWLQALGFDRNTRIYMAAGKLYDEKRAMAPFYAMFPHVYTKDMLVTKREAAFMRGKSNIRAAVDMHVLVNADVTTLTFEGMMGEIVMGHRKWLGHKKTMKAPAFGFNKFGGSDMGSLSLGNNSWEFFSQEMRGWTYMEAGDGSPMKRQDRSWSEALFANPLPDCMCPSGQRNRTN